MANTGSFSQYIYSIQKLVTLFFNNNNNNNNNRVVIKCQLTHDLCVVGIFLITIFHRGSRCPTRPRGRLVYVFKN